MVTKQGLYTVSSQNNTSKNSKKNAPKVFNEQETVPLWCHQQSEGQDFLFFCTFFHVLMYF